MTVPSPYTLTLVDLLTWSLMTDTYVSRLVDAVPNDRHGGVEVDGEVGFHGLNNPIVFQIVIVALNWNGRI